LHVLLEVVAGPDGQPPACGTLHGGAFVVEQLQQHGNRLVLSDVRNRLDRRAALVGHQLRVAGHFLQAGAQGSPGHRIGLDAPGRCESSTTHVHGLVEQPIGDRTSSIATGQFTQEEDCPAAYGRVAVRRTHG